MLITCELIFFFLLVEGAKLTGSTNKLFLCLLSFSKGGIPWNLERRVLRMLFDKELCFSNVADFEVTEKVENVT